MWRIVVGVDGSKGSARALRWAVDEARSRGAAVEAVHVWHYSFPYYVGAPLYPPVGLVSQEEMEAAARHCLDQAVDHVDPSGLAAPVERILVQGGTARTLLDVAKGADLLVLGTHGHGGFAGMVLGSVSQHVAHHTPCPLVLVPDEP